MKNIRVGAMPSSAADAVRVGSELYWPVRMPIETETVWLSLDTSSTRGMRNYYTMRVGRLPLVPYYAPGDEDLAMAVKAVAGKHHAVLLANHGPVVAGTTLRDAQYAIEELEETAKLFLMLDGKAIRPLTGLQAAALRK